MVWPLHDESRAMFVRLFVLLAWSFFCLAPAHPETVNKHTLVHYYGWFKADWGSVNCNPDTGRCGTGICDAPNCGGGVVYGQQLPECHTWNTSTPHAHAGRSSYDINCYFYPRLLYEGTYNSWSTTTIAQHRSDIVKAGAKGVILSYGRGGDPDTGLITTIAKTLTQSGNGDLRVAYAIRDYPGRTLCDNVIETAVSLELV